MEEIVVEQTETHTVQVEQDKYSFEYIEKIKNNIEAMDKYHQVEILKILSKNSSKINENKSGVYVNLSFLSKQTLDELKEYIDYIHDQEESLVTMEYQKEEFKNSFFIEKEDKDNPLVSYYNK
jgi:hypothetical protein